MYICMDFIPKYLYIYIYIYICMDSPDISTRDSSLVASRRDLDASERGRDVARRKKRMLGVTPVIVTSGSVEPPQNAKVGLWRPP